MDTIIVLKIGVDSGGLFIRVKGLLSTERIISRKVIRIYHREKLEIIEKFQCERTKNDAVVTMLNDNVLKKYVTEIKVNNASATLLYNPYNDTNHWIYADNIY